MYELVKRILDKSRDAGMDVFVACDMCVAEDKENADAIRAAGEIVITHYDAITKCRRENDEASIEKLCELVVSGDAVALRKFKEEIKER